MNLTICEAIRARKLLMFAYGDLMRIVEPHLYGVNAAGHEVLSAWLRPGLSRADPGGWWRTYRVDEISALRLLDESFDAPREGYNPNDARMVRVHCGIEREEGDTMSEE